VNQKHEPNREGWHHIGSLANHEYYLHPNGNVIDEYYLGSHITEIHEKHSAEARKILLYCHVVKKGD